MRVERTGGSADEPDGTDQGDDQPSRPARPAQAGRVEEPGQPSRADARRAAMEANQKPSGMTAERSDADGLSGGGPQATGETSLKGERGAVSRDRLPQENRQEGTLGPASTDQGTAGGQPDRGTHVSPLERMPSYGDFANLDEEFTARVESREMAGQRDDATNDSASKSAVIERDVASPVLDTRSIREKIDPFAPDIDKAQARKEPFQPMFTDKGGKWTEDSGSAGDQPNGEKLNEPSEEGVEDSTNKNVDRDKRSRGERLRAKLFEHGDDALDATQESVNEIAGIFDRPQPTGSHAVAKTDQPIIEAPPHGVDAGEAATALIAGAVVAGKLYHWGREMVSRKRRDDDGHG